VVFTSATYRPTPGAIQEGDETNTGTIVGAVAGSIVFLVITIIVLGIIAWHCR